jgi:hypothetical protein
MAVESKVKNSHEDVLPLQPALHRAKLSQERCELRVFELFISRWLSDMRCDSPVCSGSDDKLEGDSDLLRTSG